MRLSFVRTKRKCSERKKRRNKIEQFVVGQPFTTFAPADKFRFYDGAVMEAIADYGLGVMMFLNQMTEEEEELLNSGRLDFRVIHEGDFVLALARFGNSPLIFELSFDPTLYTDERKNSLYDSNLVFLFGIESTTLILRTLRVGNMPRRLKEIWHGTWQKALHIPDYSARYQRWVADLDSRQLVLLHIV